jgi:hypothetical protein
MDDLIPIRIVPMFLLSGTILMAFIGKMFC